MVHLISTSFCIIFLELAGITAFHNTGAFQTFLSTSAEAVKLTKIVQIEDEGVIIHTIITSSATVSLILL